jgi:hypothetical protein
MLPSHPSRNSLWHPAVPSARIRSGALEKWMCWGLSRPMQMWPGAGFVLLPPGNGEVHEQSSCTAIRAVRKRLRIVLVGNKPALRAGSVHHKPNASLYPSTNIAKPASHEEIHSQAGLLPQQSRRSSKGGGVPWVGLERVALLLPCPSPSTWYDTMWWAKPMISTHAPLSWSGREPADTGEGAPCGPVGLTIPPGHSIRLAITLWYPPVR